MVRIYIRQGGSLGNHMYQYMLSKTLEYDIDRPVEICGYDMEAWDLHMMAEELPTEKVFEIYSNFFDYNSLVKRANDGEVDNIVVRTLAMRMEYYKAPSFYNSLFIPSPEKVKDVPIIGADKLLIHVRGGDILKGVHPDHYPLPLNYYHHLIELTGLKPVFIGQICDDKYSQTLKKEFGKYEMLTQASVLEDFETIRRAKNVAIAVSSFSWMATWLSKDAEKIYCPIAGFLHPDQRPDIDVLPSSDNRYVFFQFPVWYFKGGSDDYSKIYGNMIPFHQVQTLREKSRFQAELEWLIKSKMNALKKRLTKIGF